jgi:hypothetical protein
MAKLLVQLPSVLSVTLTSDSDPFLKETINSNPDPLKEKSGGSWSTIQCFLSIKKTSNMDFVECRHINQYGILQRRIIGTGTTAAVKLTRRIDSNGKMQTYAVKAFRKKKVRESDKSFMKKLISEFCIASTLDHPNIVQTLDLVKDKKGRYCTIMEYVSLLMCIWYTSISIYNHI